MDSLNGKIILSTAMLNGTFFEQTVIFIAEHNADGCLGFIVNRPSGKYLNELTEFAAAPALPLYDGGPMQQDMIYCLHDAADQINESIYITNNIAMGGSFDETLALLTDGKPAINLQCFLGYCGWDADELEAEIAEGSWLLTNAPANLVFASDENLWENLLLDYSANS